MRLDHAIKLRDMAHKAAASLSDGYALEAVELTEPWAAGIEYPDKKRLRYCGKLYRTKMAHTSQADWTPNVAVSLYEEVPKPGQGDDPSNPIPYNNNMTLIKDKYYSQYDITYICIRDTVNPVYNDLSALIGLYVEIYLNN